MKYTFWLYPARAVEHEQREVDLPHTKIELSPDATEGPSYKALSAVLDPLFFKRPWEHVSVLFEGRRTDMFVDESGVLDGLPRNEAATAIYRANWLSQYPHADPESLPHIAGLAVVFEKRVWY